mmetsp:Transcript_6197/g.8059  ORF Transcript_6197/g.8059 Transcript_6197/m.8059 type:complete len:87 (+) Transcript_6197:208-468(+)
MYQSYTDFRRSFRLTQEPVNFLFIRKNPIPLKKLKRRLDELLGVVDTFSGNTEGVAFDEESEESPEVEEWSEEKESVVESSGIIKE